VSFSASCATWNGLPAAAENQRDGMTIDCAADSAVVARRFLAERTNTSQESTFGGEAVGARRGG